MTHAECTHPQRVERATCFRVYTARNRLMVPRVTPRKLPHVDYYRATGWLETRQWDCQVCGIVIETVRQAPDPV